MIKQFLILAFLLVSKSVFAIKCGSVPVYCIMEIDSTTDHTTSYYETMPLIAACIETTYEFPNAAPICKIEPIDKEALYNKCRVLYPDGPSERVIGIAYYKGGDPVSPLSNTNPHLWGNGFYKLTDLLLPPKNPKVKVRAFPGCDVISDAL